MIQNCIHGLYAWILKVYNKFRVFHLFRRWNSKVPALRWDQIIWMAVVGLAIWVLIQNDNNAKTLASTLISTVQNTLQNMLTGSY